MQEVKKRIWELDALRGIAIILMVAFHLVFNLDVFYGVESLNYREGFWYYEGRVAAITFIVLVGVVSSIIHSRSDHTVSLQKNSLRGLRLIGLGLIVTMASYVFDPPNTIWFGILHFLGLSILISIPLLRFKWINVVLGLVLLAAHYPISSIYSESYLGLIFGIYPPTFTSYDHYALIPWLGYVLIGIALGNWVYPKGKAVLGAQPKAMKALAVTGKYSLWIYLIHQPVLLFVLWILLR